MISVILKIGSDVIMFGKKEISRWNHSFIDETS